MKSEEASKLYLEGIKCTEIFRMMEYDFERRTCENCKLGEHTQHGYVECSLEIFKNTEEFFDKDFGCNMWEAK